METNARTVRTLIGHKQVDVGLRCLGSLIRCSSEPISLVVHDDGTLTPGDRTRLTSELEGVSILNRAEADSVVLPLLHSYPNCRTYRRHHPLALKLIDIALIETGDLAYCDSDILFLKPFTRLFSWPGGDGAAVFMQDSQEAYSLYPWHAHPFGKIKVPQKINSGLILFRSSEYDLDFLEWLLGQPQLEQVFEKRPHWIEQTCWAALGCRVGCYVWSARQLLIANLKMDHVTDDTVGIHFVAAYRGNLKLFSEQTSTGLAAAQAVGINAAPATSTSCFRLLAQDIRRRL
jgi:hypothetical protein